MASKYMFIQTENICLVNEKHQPDENEHDQPRPCGCSKGGRNLVVCIDGTANQVSVKVGTMLLESDSPADTWSLEQQRRRALQPSRQGRDPAHLLQQWYRHIRQGLESACSIETRYCPWVGHGCSVVRILFIIMLHCDVNGGWGNIN